MEKQQLTQEEINSLSQLQLDTQNIIIQFGQLEYEIQLLERSKKILTSNLNTLKFREQELTETLQQKYGDGNIDLKTGEITPLS